VRSHLQLKECDSNTSIINGTPKKFINMIIDKNNFKKENRKYSSNQLKDSLDIDLNNKRDKTFDG